MTMYERIISRLAAKIKADWPHGNAEQSATTHNDAFFVEIAIEDIDNMSNTDFLQLLSSDNADVR